jgi:hypothetical protein
LGRDVFGSSGSSKTDEMGPASTVAKFLADSADVTQVLVRAPVSESAVTSIIRLDAPVKVPVFVDPSGRRRRRVRRVAYGIGVAVFLIVSTVWVSQFNGWAKPPAPASSNVGK